MVNNDLLCGAGQSTIQLGLGFLSYYLNLG